LNKSAYAGAAGLTIQLCRLYTAFEERTIPPNKKVKSELIERWSKRPADTKWVEGQKQYVRQSNGHAVSEAHVLIARFVDADTGDDAVWRFSYLDKNIAGEIDREARKMRSPDNPKKIAPLWHAFWKLTTEKIDERYEFCFEPGARAGDIGGPDENDRMIGADIAAETLAEVRELKDPKLVPSIAAPMSARTPLRVIESGNRAAAAYRPAPWETEAPRDEGAPAPTSARDYDNNNPPF